MNILMLATAVLVAGNETTRNLLAGTMWALAQHPDQMRKLAADPSLVKQTVEEVLRWITPVPGFIAQRQAGHRAARSEDQRRGSMCYLLYFAANRDEECWTDPDTFDITRPPEPAVLSFGFGQHACIGAAVARLEARVFLEEMLDPFLQRLPGRRSQARWLTAAARLARAAGRVRTVTVIGRLRPPRSKGGGA